jgi:hypothetical protein
MTDTRVASGHLGYLLPRRGINWRSIIGFELVWLLLVVYQSIAIWPALLYLLYGLYYLPSRARLAVLLTAGLGIAMDALLVWAGVIAFSGSVLIPLWFLVLWTVFALAVVETMAAFMRPWWLGLLLGATGGPLSYLGGAALSGEILQFPAGTWSFVVLVVIWGLLGMALGYCRRFYAQTTG